MTLIARICTDFFIFYLIIHGNQRYSRSIKLLYSINFYLITIHKSSMIGASNIIRIPITCPPADQIIWSRRSSPFQTSEVIVIDLVVYSISLSSFLFPRIENITKKITIIPLIVIIIINLLNSCETDKSAS